MYYFCSERDVICLRHYVDVTRIWASHQSEKTVDRFHLLYKKVSILNLPHHTRLPYYPDYTVDECKWQSEISLMHCMKLVYVY